MIVLEHENCNTDLIDVERVVPPVTATAICQVTLGFPLDFPLDATLDPRYQQFVRTLSLLDDPQDRLRLVGLHFTIRCLRNDGGERVAILYAQPTP